MGPQEPEMSSAAGDSGGRAQHMSIHSAAVRTADCKNAATGPAEPDLAEGIFSNPHSLLKLWGGAEDSAPAVYFANNAA